MAQFDETKMITTKGPVLLELDATNAISLSETSYNGNSNKLRIQSMWRRLGEENWNYGKAVTIPQEKETAFAQELLKFVS